MKFEDILAKVPLIFFSLLAIVVLIIGLVKTDPYSILFGGMGVGVLLGIYVGQQIDWVLGRRSEKEIDKRVKKIIDFYKP